MNINLYIRKQDQSPQDGETIPDSGDGCQGSDDGGDDGGDDNGDDGGDGGGDNGDGGGDDGDGDGGSDNGDGGDDGGDGGAERLGISWILGLSYLGVRAIF